MNSKAPFSKKKVGLWLVIGLTVVGCLIGLNSFLSIGKHGRFIASQLKHQSPPNLLGLYQQAWINVQKKVKHLSIVEEENSKLHLENANLKLKLESLQFKKNSEHESKTTEQYALKLSEKTGVRIGRALASVDYKVPTELPSSQLYMMGIAYLKTHEEEKAAAILSSLIKSKDAEIYRTPKNLLLTGMAWFRVDNFVLADHFFDEVLKNPEDSNTIKYQAQARLWKALVAKKLKKEIKSQYWLNELVEHHPHSQEASWVNHARKENAHESHVSKSH